MDDEEKTELVEMDDGEMGSEKKSRRSSILKPQKPRNPFSTLDFSESNPDTTLARATRRVSFASSNLVKPFAADPEKNTIWDNTYEEEVNHTDSTKSSCDQTQGTKTCDVLNVSSVYSTSHSYQNEKITFGASSIVTENININEEKVQTLNIASEPGESLVSLARKLRSQSSESNTVEMDFTLINKSDFPKFPPNEVSGKANFKPQQNISISTSTKTENMEITACQLDKENVNPIINDLSLVVLRQNSLSSKSVTNDVHGFDKPESDEASDISEETSAKNENIDMEKCATAMELTCISEDNSKKQIDGNTNKIGTTRNKTVYFNDSANDMEFTNTYENVELQEKSVAGHKQQKTIIFDQTGGTMEFTLLNNSDLNLKESAEADKTAELKNKTIFSDVLDMEFTETLPVKIHSNPIPSTFQFPSRLKREETIRFKNSGEEMEFTDVLTTQNNAIEDEKSLQESKRNTESMETVNNATIARAEDMEFTAVLPTKTVNKKVIQTEIESSKTGEVVSKGVDIKRHLTKCVDEDTIKKRRIEQAHPNEEPGLKSNETIETSGTIEAKHTLPALDCNSSEVLPHATLSDDSEPIQLKLKSPKFEPLHDLSVSTPATSFHLNLSGMSPCTEDTQQLIHATFSKPETLKVFNASKECRRIGGSASDIPVKVNEKTVLEEDKTRSFQDKCETYIVSESFSQKPDADFIKIAKQELEGDKSYYLGDTSPLALVPEEFDNSISEAKSPNRDNSEIEAAKRGSFNESRGSDVLNYTVRSQMVLNNIKELLARPYEPVKPQKSSTMSKLKKEFEENCRLIKEICSKEPVVIDLEEMHKREVEETRKCNMEKNFTSDEATSAEEEVGATLAQALVAPKTLRERICEMGERAKKYWQFVKEKDDYYYFYTLFRTLPFKVHVHPELGIVYSIETYTNLSDIVLTICWYQLKLFQQRLRYENLLSVLGAKFDIFALLDYVYMSAEEIVSFHSEYLSLLKKYGKSHHFRMNPDYSITFEIMDVKLIICWIITTKMSLSSPFSITKEDVTAVHKVGQVVNEDHIRTIAENTAKGPNFFRNFIENVDEYAKRIGRKIKK